MSKMTCHELTALKEIARPGSQGGIHWGAAMLSAFEFLRTSGYITNGAPPELTDKGKAMFHDWHLAGATTGSDGYVCTKCGARVEVPADYEPPLEVCNV